MSAIPACFARLKAFEAGPALCLALLFGLSLSACDRSVEQRRAQPTEAVLSSASGAPGAVAERFDRLAEVTLTTDLSHLETSDVRVLRYLIHAVQPMDSVFWQQSWGDRAALFERQDCADRTLRRYLEVNYGPWDRWADGEAFVTAVGARPAGARFYASDVDDAQFRKAAADPVFLSPYTIIVRAQDGALRARPAHEHFAREHEASAALLHGTALMTGEPAFARYLELRAQALLTDSYATSNQAWAQLEDNLIDVVIGPGPTHEDRRYGLKAAHEGLVLVRDLEWMRRIDLLERRWQDAGRAMPELAASATQLPPRVGVFDVVYAAGSTNAGPKHGSLVRPVAHASVARASGAAAPTDRAFPTRHLILRNVVQARYDKLVAPLGDVLLDESAAAAMTASAYLNAQVIRALSHGWMPARPQVQGRRTPLETLPLERLPYDAFEVLAEAAAHALSLHVGTYLLDQDAVLLDGDTPDGFATTWLASTLDAIRLDRDDPGHRAALLVFNYLAERDALVRDPATGRYRMDAEAQRVAVPEVVDLLFTALRDGAAETATVLVEQQTQLAPLLATDLERLDAAEVPVGLVYDQGARVLF